MKYIVLDWETYLSDPKYWQHISDHKAIPLHIGTDLENMGLVRPAIWNNQQEAAE